MSALQRAATLLFLSILATVSWIGVANAQGGNAKSPNTAPSTYDNVADVTDEWTTKYGDRDGSGVPPPHLGLE